MSKHSASGRRNGVSRSALLLTAVLALAGSAPLAASAQQALPTPEAHFGYAMGTAENLARWDEILDYYTLLANGSDRMVVDTLGMTTLGNPYVAVWISSPENLARRDEIRMGSAALAAGQISQAEARELASNIPSTVVLHHNIHSTEIGASQTSVELVYQLVAAQGGVEEEILDDVITVLIPSGNPDGQIMVTDWYRSVVGTDYEESSMPFLYHHYAGHDNNRDFFQGNLVETQHWMKLMFEQAFPQIYLDQHQMGSSGPRIFVPPYPDPMDPKIHPLQWQSLQFVGGGIVADLQAAGKQGVISGEMYRIWGQEGALTGRHHNIISLLTETASSNLASPVNVTRAQLERSRNINAGQQPYGFGISFPDPWWGGEWALQDIVDYQMVAAMSVLTQAARFRDMYLYRRWQMASETIERAAEEGPYAYVVPIEQMDPAAATDMVRRLSMQGVEIHRALSAFDAVPGVEPIPNSWARADEDASGDAEDADSDEDAEHDDDGDEDHANADGDGHDEDEMARTFPAGSWVILMQQNARAALLDLLEIQDRELLYEFPGGPILRSYDGAAYTMPLQMGVEAVRIDDAFDASLEEVAEVTFPAPGVPQAQQFYVLDGAVTASYAAANELMANGVQVSRRGDDFIVPASYPEARGILERHHQMQGLPVEVDPQEMTAAAPIRRSRIGLYQGWGNSMDEGWTRLMLEEYGFDYEVLKGPDVAAGDLGARFDAIVFPAEMSVNQIVEGRDADDYPEEYAGGIGEEGLEALRAFVRAGGTLVTLDSADQLVLQHFDVPIESATADVARDEMFQPSSIYRLDLDEGHDLTRGSTASVAAKWAGGRAWQPTAWSGEGDVGAIRTVGHWPTDPDEILMSGLLMGGEHLAGKAAILDIEFGEGRIYMYGFRVQHRGQTTGTLKLLFNAFVPVSPRTATQ